MPRCVTLSDSQSFVLTKSETAAVYHYNLYHTFSDIPPLYLEELETAQHFLFSAPYWSAYEKAYAEHMQFRYVILLKHGHPIGLAPFQIILFKGSFVATRQRANNFWQSTIKSITARFVNACKIRLLVGGNAFVTGPYALLLKKGLSWNAEIVQTYYQAVNQIVQEEKNISGILLKDFYAESASYLDGLQKNGFLRFEVNPNMEMPICAEWINMQDYEKSLNSHYRVRYRKALERGKALRFSDITLNQWESHSAEISHLMNLVISQSEFKLAHPDITYLKYLLAEAPENFFMKGVFLHEKLIGFYSAYLNNDKLIACLVGMNKTWLKSHDLYLNILYQLVQLAIEHKVKTLHFGRTAMEIKSSIGACPQAMFLYVKHVCLVRNLLIQWAVKILSQQPRWTQRHPFRKNNQPAVSNKN